MERSTILFACLIVCCLVLSNNLCLSYLNYAVDANNICSPLKNNTLTLGAKHNDHGAVVNETSRFSSWFDKKLSKCRFEVIELHRNKIVAVIQKLSFRQDEFGNCTDYVQFKSGTEESEKFCGFIRATRPGTPRMDPYVPAGNIAPNAFVVQEEGKLDVIIYVADKKLRPEQELDLEIVFTSAQDCPTASHEYSVCGYNLCIRREFVKDGFVNCPFVNCPDEDGCYRATPERRKLGFGSRVTVGAITAVLMSFVLFFGCIWLSRRYQKICWSADFSHARISRMIQVPPAVPTECNGETCQHVTENTPNPIPLPPHVCGTDVAAAVTPDDKDLPPPYESLFPGR